MKWIRLFGQSDPSASMQINPDATISPINPLGPPATGGVYWDSTLTGRIRLGAVLLKKSGTDGIPGFAIDLMTDSSIESGDGYGFRIQENAGTDAFGIVRIASNGTSSPSITPIATGSRELVAGDTLLFDVYPSGVKKGTIRGAGGGVDSVSVLDTMFNPGSWKGWLTGTVFSDSVKVDDFILGTIPYTVTASAGGDGSISPPGNVEVDSGGSRTFTITPNTGYHIDSVVVDGVNQGTNGTYNFTNVTADHSIAAYFSINSYKIIASASAGGSISPLDTVNVNHGSSQLFTISPNTGYHIDSVVVDGVDQGTGGTYNFTNVTADHSIAAYFSINSYKIVATSSAGGSISPTDTVNVDYGGSRLFTLTPNTGFHIDSVVVDGVDQGTGGTYNFTNVTADHSIAAYFSINVYVLTATVSSGGSISPSGTINASYGANQSFSITPNTGYHIDSVVVDGVDQGAVASYDFTTISANHTIDAYCSINVYQITASASAGGSISPTGSVGVNYGANQAFSITPTTGYHIDSVVADGVNLGAVGSHTFTIVTANHTIAAYFSIDVFTITATASSGGSILPFGSVAVNYGSNRSFTMTPNTGSHIDSVVVDGINQGPVSSYNFTSITANHSIMAYFSIDVFTITATAEAGGSITPSGAVGVSYGANRSFTITPDVGYHTDSVVVDGVNLGVTGSYTFTNVTGNHQIGAWFSIDVKTITAAAGAGGSISPSGVVNVNYGSNQSFVITPDTGFHVDSVVVDGINEGPMTGRDFTNVTTNHSVNAYFSINVYTITATASSGGSISPSGAVAVNYGGNQSFTVTPDTGYHIDSVVVDGLNEGVITSRAFTNVTAVHAISAYFSIDTFSITATAGSGGSISPSGILGVNYGSGQSFTITPNTGYHVDSVVVDGIDEGALTSRNFTNVTANHTIAAYFSIDAFTIEASAGSGGSISPSGTVNVNYGAGQLFTVTPDTGYHIDSVVVDGVDEGPVTSRNFTNVTANHTIAAYFSIDVFTIDASAGAGGSISPSGSVNVNYGAGQLFTVTPNTGYHTDSVVVDGVNEGVVTSRNFTNVTASHTIAAYFSIDVLTISASAGTGGSISPSGTVNVNYGSAQSFSVTPDTGHHIDSVVVDGVNEGAISSRNFTNVTAPHTIAAYFSIDVFTISASAGPGGSISPSGTVDVNYGSAQAFSVNPNTGYHIDSVVVDGTNEGAITGRTFTNVTANHTIAAYFSIDVFTIDASAGAGGTISPSGTVNVNYGSSQAFSVTPDTGYHIDSVVVDGINEGALTGRTFTNVTANHTIAAYFSIDVFTIDATSSAGGSISPAGTLNVDYGGGQSFTITPITGYHIDSIVVDGVNEGVVTNRNFTNVTANHTIAAWFSIDLFTITVNSVGNGSVSPTGDVSVGYGMNQAFVVTPDSGYHTDSVLVDGFDQGTGVNFLFSNVIANHTITAYFSINVYTISATASAGGSISPPGDTDINHGGSQAYTITPDPGFHIDSVVVDGTNEGALTGRTFTSVSGGHTIDAYFSIDVFTITATADVGGSISPSGAVAVNYGSAQSFTISTVTGYHLDSVVVDGVDQGPVASYNFTNVTSNRTIAAYFTINDYTIVATAGTGGSITPSGAVSVTFGSNQSFAISADTGYHIDSVVVDGAGQGPLTSYDFTNITVSHAINAYFSRDTFHITASAGAGGSISPSGTIVIDYGSDTSFSFTPNTGYHIDSVLVDGTNVGSPSSYQFSGVTSAHSVAAYFSIDMLDITASSSAGGSISPAGTITLPYGSSQSFSMLAETGLHLDSVLVDGVNQGPVPTYDFVNVVVNHTIAAYFSIDVFDITASSVGGGSVSPSGVVKVNYGENRQFIVTPDTGYHTDSVLVDGFDQGNGVNFTFSNVTGNHTFTAYFSIDVFTVTATAAAGGTISPSGAVGVDYGGDRSFTIVPDAGYHIDSVVVDGVNQGAVSAYDMTNITADHTIDAYFSINVYTITSGANGGGGISPAGSINANHGTTVNISITPNTGYHIDSVVVDGVNQGVVTAYTFSNLTSGHTITAWFSINILTITSTASAGGTITPTGSVDLTYGSSQTFTITPDTGYHIDSVVVNNLDRGPLTSYTFSSVTTSHTIHAYFSINGYTITATASPGGKINPQGSVVVAHGGSRSFSITPNPGNHLDSVVVDGANLGLITSYNFTNVTAPHSIAAWFSPTYFTVTATADSGGTISPPGAVQVLEGGDQSFTIVPSPGYLILDVLVDSVSVGSVSSYTITNVTGPHTIRATFVKSSYVIVASSSPGGSISPSGTVGVEYGDDTTFVLVPAVGYKIDSLRVDGVNVGTPSSYTFTNITVSHTISAFFSIKRYTITASSAGNGTVTPSGTTTLTHGSDQSYSFTPDTGYVVQDVRVDGVSVGVVTTYDFTGVSANHTIQVTFAIRKFTVTTTAGPNGAVSPAGVSQVNYGGSLTVFITPASGYFVLGVVVDSTPVGAVTSYSFNNVTRNHTVEATFTSNAPPSPPRLLTPTNNRVISTGSLDALYFAWSPSIDANAGDVLKYVLTISGPNVNFSTFEQTATNVTLDLGGLAFIPDSIYRWTVRVSDAQIIIASPDTFRFTVNTATAVGDQGGLPAEFALGQNYPNPFNPSTSIPFDLPERSDVSLKVYTMLGVEVSAVAGVRSLAAGSYIEKVDFPGIPSGTYIYRLTAKGESGSVFQMSKKLVIIR